jgi:type VI protein secretion system component VasK
VLLERDLATVRDTLQVDCPLLAAVVDAEKGPGAEELLSRFPDQQRKRRLGLEFPRTADCDAASVPAMIEEGTAWVCRSLFPPLVYRLARAGRPERREEEADLAGNVQLYHFLQQVRRREKPLARILTRGINPDGRGPWRPRGLYLAATGPDATHQQGFAAGIFPQLVEMQNDGAWTPHALTEDAARRRWAAAGYSALAAALIAVAALGLFL